MAWGSCGTAEGEFHCPTGIAVDALGNVYVTDGCRVQKFAADASFVKAWGVFGSGEAQFIFPNGVAVDAAQNVYVVDTNNHRIQKFVPFSFFAVLRRLFMEIVRLLGLR
jgi:DNA-binding beta-propeller fold protein YncE